LPAIICEAISQVAAPLGGKNARRGAIKEVSGGLEVIVSVYAPTMASAHEVEAALTLTDVHNAMVEILGERLNFSCRVAWLQFHLEQVGCPPAMTRNRDGICFNTALLFNLAIC
jgi:hypothetical protein